MARVNLAPLNALHLMHLRQAAQQGLWAARQDLEAALMNLRNHIIEAAAHTQFRSYDLDTGESFNRKSGLMGMVVGVILENPDSQEYLLEVAVPGKAQIWRLPLSEIKSIVVKETLEEVFWI